MIEALAVAQAPALSTRNRVLSLSLLQVRTLPSRVMTSNRARHELIQLPTIIKVRPLLGTRRQSGNLPGGDGPRFGRGRGRSPVPGPVLGPDLRVLILLEYPGVSPRGSPGKAMVKEVGAGRRPASRGRVQVIAGIEHQLATSIDVCFLPRQRQRQRDPHRKRRRPSSINDFLPTIGFFTAEFIREFPINVLQPLYVSAYRDSSVARCLHLNRGARDT